MKILVLGGAGYIGSHTVKALCDEGHDVTVVDNLVTGYRSAVDERAEFIEGDLRDVPMMTELMIEKGIEGVMHFAAFSLVGESVEKPLKYYDNNLCGSIALLQAMENTGVNMLVFSSTAATYGEPENIPILESDPTCPTNPYGETKLAMEKAFYWQSRAKDLRYVALRYFNACGADEGGFIGEAHRPESHLIPIILQVPLGQREEVSIYGADYPTPDGTCIRDYIHVTDLAKAHILAMDYLEKGGESNVFNLGSGNGFSVREVIETARKVTGHPIPAKETPRRPGDPARLVASSEKAKRILGWEPQFENLELIVSSAWNWHKSHPNGYN